jgi:hypothetical protein
MASSVSPVGVEADLSQDSDVLSNISAADLLFYRAVELQTGLIQNYRNAIFNMVVVAADVAGRMPKSAAQEGIKAAKAVTDSRKKEAEHALRTSAESNRGNVVAATNLLMNNCVEALQQLDVIADAALVQCVEMILGAVASA